FRSTLARQCSRLSSSCWTDSMPSMKRGNSSNWVHWSYATRTGTLTSMDFFTVGMSCLLRRFLHELLLRLLLQRRHLRAEVFELVLGEDLLHLREQLLFLLLDVVLEVLLDGLFGLVVILLQQAETVHARSFSSRARGTGRARHVPVTCVPDGCEPAVRANV